MRKKFYAIISFIVFMFLISININAQNNEIKKRNGIGVMYYNRIQVQDMYR